MVFLLLALLHAPSAFSYGEPPGPAPSTFVDVPLYDAPFNYERGGYTFPSMRQSLALSTSTYENVHRLIGGTQADDQWWRLWGVIGYDLMSYWLPLGNNWMRAEWHRSVLSRNDISSYDDIYRFKIFSDTISVTNVSDTDLMRLKQDHPADMVRMSSAGFESRLAQNLLVERHHFFDSAQTFDQFLLWMNALNSTVYLSVCGSNSANLTIDKMRTTEGRDIGKRDFSGLDCTAWVYDLFRPDEAYTGRGVHPSGLGVNRYIQLSQLNSRERDFLRRQQFYSLFNFVDPFLYGREGWDGKVFGHEFRWTANLAHTLTSFGYDVDARLFLRHEAEKYLFTLHNGFGLHYYPGITAEWIDHPVGDGFFFTSALTLWTQPLGQRFDAKENQWLIDALAQFSFQWNPATSTYFGVEAKSPGWILGDPYLDGKVSVFTGFKMALF